MIDGVINLNPDWVIRIPIVDIVPLIKFPYKLSPAACDPYRCWTSNDYESGLPELMWEIFHRDEGHDPQDEGYDLTVARL